MSRLFVSHGSAFKMYRMHRLSKVNWNFRSTNIVPAESMTVLVDSVEKLKSETSLNKIDVLVSSRNRRYKNKSMVFHNNCRSYPKSSFVKIQDEIFMSSPELLFCQMAETLNIAKLFLLGLELCGTYTVDNTIDRGFRSELKPITSASKILRYCNELKKLQLQQKGMSNAWMVANLLSDFSASPQESRLYIILTLPRSYGGFGLKDLKFNCRINLSKEAQAICGRTHIKPDLCNQKNKIAIEYDSDAFHSEISQNRTDKKRLDALNYDGWTTYNFISEYMHDVVAFRHLATDILKKNQQSHRIRIKDFNSRLHKLMNEL